jgi:hypothetical protein
MAEKYFYLTVKYLFCTISLVAKMAAKLSCLRQKVFVARFFL